MKLNGRIATVNVVTEVFFRENEEPLVFKARAVMDNDDFATYVPMPTPPLLRRPGDEVGTPDFTDQKYVKAMQKRVTLQTYWLILKSLEATPNLVWETVKIEDPETWENIDEELKEFGLSNVEKTKLIQAVMRANSLDEKFIEAAKLRFTRSLEAAKIQAMSSQQDVPSSTKSGELASA